MSKSESLSELVVALAEGRQTPDSLAKQSLERATQLADLNAFVAIDEEIVIAQAKAATQRRKTGKPLSPIDGVPIAVKDNYLTKDYSTTACSNALPLEPKGMDATIVANLRAAGAVIFGKTNMHEWAFGATNSTSSIGATRNPHNQEHITGGSSGGSAAAVAAGIVGAALGSDTGGSVRIPSSACGVYGFKPTYGRASRHGVLPLSWSLDAPGPIAAGLDDIALLLPYFLGADKRDASTTLAKPFSPETAPEKLRVFHLTGAGLERADEVNRVVCSALSAPDVTVADASLPDMCSYFAAWETILHVEASSFHEALLSRTDSGFSSVTRAHLEAGKQLTAQEALHAQKLRARFSDLLLNGLGDWDALALPTLPVVAPRHGEDRQKFGGRNVTTQDSMTWFCWLGNLAGLPCISLPTGVSKNGLPIGMMLMGRPGKDEVLLDIARRFDKRP
ncbi:amidase [Defluviimonas aestuarii]|uniref:amidase n=1 Tax=Albidovulum aestuarii TaxID=1130726 RepID=UPI00249ACC55|nr:amidase [Defluviimonas aestuarii]MDI3335641.1 amidase [Defluviimonas aestuarii]